MPVAQEIKQPTITLRHPHKPDVTWTNDPTVTSHHPMDRVGGPFRLHVVIDEHASPDDPWFVMACVDSWFPQYAAIHAATVEDAVEDLLTYTDWFTIEADQLSDYKEDDVTYDSNGRPCCTDNLNHGQDVPWVVEKFLEAP